MYAKSTALFANDGTTSTSSVVPVFPSGRTSQDMEGFGSYAKRVARTLLVLTTTSGTVLLNHHWDVTADGGVARISWHGYETIDAAPTQSPVQEATEWLKSATGISWERIARLLGVTRQAVEGWRGGAPLHDQHWQRLFAVRDVLGRAAARHPSVDALKAWLDTPRGVDGRTLAQLLEANEIDKARFLAVTKPSRKVTPAPVWVRRPTPPAFSRGQEARMDARPAEPVDEEDYLLVPDDDDHADEGWVE